MKFTEFLIEQLDGGTNCILIGEDEHVLHNGMNALYESRLILQKYKKSIVILLEQLHAIEKNGNNCPYTLENLERSEIIQSNIYQYLRQLISKGFLVYGLENAKSDPFSHIKTEEELMKAVDNFPLIRLQETFCFESKKFIALQKYTFSDARIQRANEVFADYVSKIPREKIVIVICGATHIPRGSNSNTSVIIDHGLEKRLKSLGRNCAATLVVHEENYQNRRACEKCYCAPNSSDDPSIYGPIGWVTTVSDTSLGFIPQNSNARLFSNTTSQQQEDSRCCLQYSCCKLV